MICEILYFIEIMKMKYSIAIVLFAASQLFAQEAQSIYDIEDSAKRLDALIAANPQVATNNISLWARPNYHDVINDYAQALEWVNEDKLSRSEEFRKMTLDFMEYKIDLPVMAYNIACADAILGKLADQVVKDLEYAILLGYDNADSISEEEDFASIATDPRFAKICEMAKVAARRNGNKKEVLKAGEGRELFIQDRNVGYDSTWDAFLCKLKANPAQIIFLDQSLEKLSSAPGEDMLYAHLPKGASEFKIDSGPSSIGFIDPDDSHYYPTIAMSSCVFDRDPKRFHVSLPASIVLSSLDLARQELFYDLANQVGIYAASIDSGCVDGIDRFYAFSPVTINYQGEDDVQGCEFARLVGEIMKIRAAKNIADASTDAINIIRHAAKCVTNETSFMSGIAHRPTLSFDQIDCAKALEEAKSLDKIPLSPYFCGNMELAFKPHLATNVERKEARNWILTKGAFCIGINAVWMEKTGAIILELCDPVDRDENHEPILGMNREFVWKVLQGDESKVRITPLDDNKLKVKIEVDYHEVFEAESPGGQKVKTSRVDIGCFHVVDSRASIPFVISFYFSPNDTREFDESGRLVSIDYDNRQIDGWVCDLCTKGDYKDIISYDEDGDFIGWKRISRDSNDTVTTNEFTREGLLVVSRDEYGRPLDVLRSLKATWQQELDLEDISSPEMLAWQGHIYDENMSHPTETSLSWKYEYKDEKDKFGTLRPLPLKPYKYNPEICLRADFSEESGFRVPMMNQMMIGYYNYVGLKYGVKEWYLRSDEIRREDGWAALKAKGLKPPEKLKKMKFSPFNESTNDLWRIDMDDIEAECARVLVELPDGAYRLLDDELGARKQNEEHGYASIQLTYSAGNAYFEEMVYKKLDENYSRCDKEEVADLLKDILEEKAIEGIYISERGKPPVPDEILDVYSSAIAMWWLEPDLYFAITAEYGTFFAERKYLFITTINGKVASLDYFNELPSRAIGNTILAANEDDAEALNNFAVLFYSGVANSGSYDEKSVIKLLEKAARLGSETAKENLKVLYENKGQTPPLSTE